MSENSKDKNGPEVAEVLSTDELNELTPGELTKRKAPETLSDIEAGDVVFLHSYRLGPTSRLMRVERVTKTQLVLENGVKYRRDNGRAVGHQSSSVTVMIATPERKWRAAGDAAYRNMVEHSHSLNFGLRNGGGIEEVRRHMAQLSAELAKFEKAQAWLERNRG